MGLGNIKMQRTSVSMHMHVSIILGVWDEAVKCRIEDDDRCQRASKDGRGTCEEDGK